jgi:hypothetical protein
MGTVTGLRLILPRGVSKTRLCYSDVLKTVTGLRLTYD